MESEICRWTAALGRFLSPDPTVEAPYDLQDLNRYSYVGNTPLSVADPSGLCRSWRCFWHLQRVQGGRQWVGQSPGR